MSLVSRKSTILETCFRYVPTMMDNVTMSMGQTLLPVNPTCGASMGRNFPLSSFNMFAELPLSTITHPVVKPAIFMVMMRASSYD
jgi:hypothetical protein